MIETAGVQYVVLFVFVLFCLLVTTLVLFKPVFKCNLYWILFSCRHICLNNARL